MTSCLGPSELTRRAAVVGQFEFLKTANNHLRHPKFIGLREDKNAGMSCESDRSLNDHLLETRLQFASCRRRSFLSRFLYRRATGASPNVWFHIG